MGTCKGLERSGCVLMKVLLSTPQEKNHENWDG